LHDDIFEAAGIEIESDIDLIEKQLAALIREDIDREILQDLIACNKNDKIQYQNDY